MQLHPTDLPGAYIIDLERYDDERGFYSVMWSPEKFAKNGLVTDLSQCSVVHNKRAGTLRGMHYQAAPWEQVKIVRCSRGIIYDVLVDLRPQSPAFKKWIGVELTPANNRAVYVPKGFAHGYQALSDDTEVMYLVSGAYKPSHERGVRWNDAMLGIQWPSISSPLTINARDNGYADFQPDHT